MKHILFIVLVLSMLCIAPCTQAGFLVKKIKTANNCVVHMQVRSEISTHNKHANFLSKLNDHLRILRPYRLHKQCEWVGIAAIACGIIGLFVPGPNLLAILFGVLGMGRGCKVEGLAITGFIMGMLELILFLLAQTVLVSLILL